MFNLTSLFKKKPIVPLSKDKDYRLVDIADVAITKETLYTYTVLVRFNIPGLRPKQFILRDEFRETESFIREADNALYIVDGSDSPKLAKDGRNVLQSRVDRVPYENTQIDKEYMTYWLSTMGYHVTTRGITSATILRRRRVKTVTLQNVMISPRFKKDLKFTDRMFLADKSSSRGSGNGALAAFTIKEHHE